MSSVTVVNGLPLLSSSSEVPPLLNSAKQLKTVTQEWSRSQKACVSLSSDYAWFKLLLKSLLGNVVALAVNVHLDFFIYLTGCSIVI